MDVAAYLDRIGFGGPVRHDVETLERLQRAHLTAVPFENLDVYHRLGVRTDPAWSIPKIVVGRRGGWCFEVNGAFAALLESLGFSVTRLAAEVVVGGAEPETPDHLAVEVSLDRPYLVDVGFGDSFIRPLPLDDPGPHDGGTGLFTFEVAGGQTMLVAEGEAGPEPQYRFRREPPPEGVFEAASRRLQRGPAGWTRAPFATRLIDGGPDRVALLGDRIKFRRGGVWEERPVAPEEWDDELEAWFGIRL